MRNRFEPDGGCKKRISIVTGVHGDELEGQYVAYLLCDWLSKNQRHICATIDIYPALNPLGIDAIRRSVPFYEVDLNRQFPGGKFDYLPAQLADGIVSAIRGSEIAIDIHSSNIFLREIPQVRISRQCSEALVPLARHLGIDFIWIHDAVTVLESTLAHTLNSLGTKTLVVEMGVGMRVTREYGQNLFDGIMHLLYQEGFISEPKPRPQRETISSLDGTVAYINSPECGLFVTELEHSQKVEKGMVVGEILDPLNGIVKSRITAPISGILFTLRAYPIVYEGSLLARIFGVKP